MHSVALCLLTRSCNVVEFGNTRMTQISLVVNLTLFVSGKSPFSSNLDSELILMSSTVCDGFVKLFVVLLFHSKLGVQTGKSKAFEWFLDSHYWLELMLF
eukprot:NODE_327_length_9598_cov_1.179914.p9 type:complete len:100 gc:universal NODE_327_length_9598_cov_1.179914:7894-7595(-)